MQTEYYDGPLHMMEKQGGSFVKSLVNAYYCADRQNKIKLEQTFKEYFEDYQQRYKRYLNEN